MSERVPAVGDRKARVVLPASADRETWLAARKHSVGASEVSAVLGVNPYATAFSVFREKAEGWEAPVFEGNVFTEWGQRLEQAIIDKAIDEIGDPWVARPGGQIWKNERWPFVHVTPDALVTRRRSWQAVGVIEAKTAGDDEGWAEGSAPFHYQLQLQTQLGMLGLKKGWLACLEMSQARNFYLAEFTFDEELFHGLMSAVERFWIEHVQEGEPPMHDFTHPATDELLRELHPKVHRQSIELPDEAQEWIAEYQRKKAVLAQAEEELAEAKNWLMFHLGDAGAAYIGENKVISYPEVTTRRINTDLLREKYPEIAEEVTVASTHRRFTVAKPPKTAAEAA